MVKSEDESSASSDLEDSVIDVSRKTWEISLFESSSSSTNNLYVYGNTFHLIPRLIGRFGSLNSLKFFSNKIEILPREVGDLVDLERLQVKLSEPVISRVSFEKWKCWKELELCKVPQRPLAFSVLGEIVSLQCLTKLSICHFSIRFLPPEIGCLKKLEELDVSFNKLKNLPNDIGELNSLKSLRVANNKLVDLPSGISCLRRLESLDLSNNRLTAIAQLKLASMQTLHYLNLKYNKLYFSCQIPAWVFCKVGGNEEDSCKDEMEKSIVEVNASNVSVRRAPGNCSCCLSTSSFPEALQSCRCSLTQRMKKGWKRRDNLQQRAREERLNYSRKWRVDGHTDDMIVQMDEEKDSFKFTLLDNRQSGLQFDGDRENLADLADCSTVNEVAQTADGVGSVASRDNLLISPDCDDKGKSGLNNIINGDDNSCLTELSSLNREYDHENESVSSSLLDFRLNEFSVRNVNSSSGTVKLSLKSKRHCDRDLDNPKPSKFRRPFDDCSSLSCKYSTESFCSIDDHLPDGFYDAGRDRPFMPLKEYEQSLCIDSREVILLDRDRDEELDAIASSAQMLLSSFRKACSGENEDYEVDNLQRASILALFISDCFGGSDRSAAVMKLRKAVVGLKKQQPFICTCWTGNACDTKQAFGMTGNLSFNELCENSLRLIKTVRNSNVVPIGTMRFGVCRHRAVLMKYLCDRADPPIPCELVRGYLDFLPHAWNAVLVRKGNLWVRMVVDACCPTDIREEMDVEYCCRYIPLCRLYPPLTTESSSFFGGLFSSLSLSHGTEKSQPRSVFHCKFGTLDAAVKVRNLEYFQASHEEIRNFEYLFLGEVRMLGALRKHSCIVEIYGHQLSSKWIPPVDGTKENRLLQSVIVMEYVKGGSLKNYLADLLESGEKHVPLDIALCIARDVACALVELHLKQIIHRDIKSENVLIDLDHKRSDGTPIVKLADFDRSVPLQSLLHTCCNGHLGIHPPDHCVGTPRWMAPEVVQAMHQRSPYGLEVDIWSYGCLLYELLTLQIPYCGQSEAELHSLLQMKRRPRLTPQLEALALFDEAEAGISLDATNIDKLKLLVELFYDCTSSEPTDRPTAQYIYDKLCEDLKQLDTAHRGSRSRS